MIDQVTANEEIESRGCPNCGRQRIKIGVGEVATLHCPECAAKARFNRPAVPLLGNVVAKVCDVGDE